MKNFDFLRFQRKTPPSKPPTGFVDLKFDSDSGNFVQINPDGTTSSVGGGPTEEEILTLLAEDPEASREAIGGAADADVLKKPWETQGCQAFWDMHNVTMAATKVANFTDLTGNGKGLTNSTDAQRGVLTATGVDLAGAGYAIDNGGITGLDFRAMTVVLIMRTYVGNTTYGSPAGMLYQIGASSPGIYLDSYNSYEYGQASHYVLPFAFHPSGGPSVFAACYGTTDVTYYNNCGKQVATVATAGTGTLARMFSTAASGSGSVLGFVAGGVFDRKLSEAEVRRIADYYGVAKATSIPHMKVMGSSTPAGYLASNYQASVIPKLCAKLGWQMSATGVNGYLMSQQAGVAQASMVPTPGHPNRWLVFMTTNDIAAAAPTAAVATYQTNLTTHLTRIRAADPTGTIILVDMPPRDGGFTGSGMNGTTYEVDRNTLNSWVRTNRVTLGIDILVSFNDSTTIGQAADLTNATYYNADKIHLSAEVGHTELANLIAKGIELGMPVIQPIIITVGDETTALTTGTGKYTFRMPYAMTLTGVRASVNTAPTGSTLVVDINEGGNTLLSTKLSIDASEKTSVTAATPAVISDVFLAEDAEISIDIDQVGSSVAGAGLKVQLLGYRTP